MKTPEMRGRIIGGENEGGKVANEHGLLVGFAWTSGVAVATGAGVCVLAAVPTSAWSLTVAAWVAGAAAAWRLSRTPPSRTLLDAVVIGGLIFCALPLVVGPDLEGVRRWVQIGPLTLNAALLAAPAMFVALALRGGWCWLAAPTVALLLVMQPDASQTTAVACATAVAATLARLRPATTAALSVTTGIAAAAAWTRADPLAPVAHVEGVVPLAWSIAPLLAVMAVSASIAVVVCLALLAGRDRSTQAAGAAVATWAAVSMLAPIVGAFPQPLVGAGAAPMMGLWLAAGLLASRRRGETLEAKAG